MVNPKARWAPPWFQRRAGPPVLASAPLRQIGGPAVESPRDALRLWDRAGLDAIFLQGHLLVRSEARQPEMKHDR